MTLNREHSLVKIQTRIFLLLLQYYRYSTNFLFAMVWIIQNICISGFKKNEEALLFQRYQQIKKINVL